MMLKHKAEAQNGKREEGSNAVLRERRGPRERESSGKESLNLKRKILLIQSKKQSKEYATVIFLGTLRLFIVTKH